MKKLLLFLLLLFTATGSFAQGYEKFYSPTKQWQPIESVAFEEIIVPVDNDTLYTILIKPKGTVKATIVYFHGAGGNISQTIKYVKPLVEDGFQVYLPDFRGNGKSTGEMTHMNIVSDAQTLFDLLLNREDIKGTTIIVYGASMGSQVATNLTRHNAGKIHALVLEGAPASFTDIAVAFASADQKEITGKYVVSPYSAKEDIKEIKGVTLLSIHSRDDKIVPFEQGEEIYSNASEPKEFWIYEGNHVDAVFILPETYLKHINRLLER